MSVPLAEIAGIAGDGYTVTLTCAAAGRCEARTELRSRAAQVGVRRADAGQTRGRRSDSARTSFAGSGSSRAPRCSASVARAKAGPSYGLGGRRARWAARRSAPSPSRPCSSKMSWWSLAQVRDLEPLFLALLGSVEFDEAAYSVRVRQWPGQEVTFSKMAGQTGEFVGCLRENRARVGREASTTLAAAVPSSRREGGRRFRECGCRAGSWRWRAWSLCVRGSARASARAGWRGSRVTRKASS